MSGDRSSPTSSLLGSKQRGYGAAMPSSGLAGPSRALQKHTRTFTHTITKSDSLNSLAVRYDTTVADIKRINKLWSNESLSLRTEVKIPLHGDIPQSNGSQTNGSQSNGSCNTNGDVTVADVAHIDCTDMGGAVSKPSTDTAGSVDFFAKFDKSLSAIKKKVDSQSTNSLQYLENDDDVLYDSAVRLDLTNGSSKRLSNISRSSNEDVKTTPEPVIRSKAKKRLERHEQRQNEELFQL